MFIELKKIKVSNWRDLRVAVSLFTSTKSCSLSTKVRVVNHQGNRQHFSWEKDVLLAVSGLKKFGSTVLTVSLKTLSGKDESTAR